MSKITTLAADKLVVKKGRKDFFDSSYPGLALRVSDTGRKVWVYFYRLQNGKVVQPASYARRVPRDGSLQQRMMLGALHISSRPVAIRLRSRTRSYRRCRSCQSSRSG